MFVWENAGTTYVLLSCLDFVVFLLSSSKLGASSLQQEPSKARDAWWSAIECTVNFGTIGQKR